MSTFQTFEEIEAWQKARELTSRVYDVSDVGAFARDFGLRDQMRRSCESTFRELNQMAARISRMISGLMEYLKQSGIKGTKYKKASG
jgi:23S rRNA-intervening sequence protein